MLVVEVMTDRATRANKRVGLLHHVGGGNLGDDATLEAVAENIIRRWPIAEIIAFSMNPDDTETRHRIKSYPVRRAGWSIGYKPAGTEAPLKARVKAVMRKYTAVSYTLKATGAVVRLTSGMFRELSFLASSRRHVKSLDLLIVSGGGQLTERDGPWGFPYTIFKWVVLARSVGVRCIFLNVGAGPLAHPLSKYFARRALMSSDYVSLRDEKSRMLLYDIGFTGESRVCPDSVYGLEFSTNVETPLNGRAQPIVGFAPMPYPDPRLNAAEKDQTIYDAFIQQLAGFASWLMGRSYALTLFGTDIGVDPVAIERLQTALLNHHGIRSSQYSVSHSVTSVRDLLAAMSRMDIVVTCRFHGVIFAHLLNKPVLAIAHHPKVSEAMADLGLLSYCVDIRDFDSEHLADRFTSMITDAEKIKSHMAASLTRKRHLFRNQFDELFRC